MIDPVLAVSKKFLGKSFRPKENNERLLLLRGRYIMNEYKCYMVQIFRGHDH